MEKGDGWRGLVIENVQEAPENRVTVGGADFQ